MTRLSHLLIDRKTTNKNLGLTILTSKELKGVIWKVEINGTIDSTQFGIYFHQNHCTKLIIHFLRIRCNRFPSQALCHYTKLSL